MIDSFSPVNPALIDQPLDPSLLIDGHSGYPDHLAREDTFSSLCEAAAETLRAFPSKLWIEAKDRPERARQNDENKTWGINYNDRFTNQNPSHECVWHSQTRASESCRNRQRAIIFKDGPKKDFRYPQSAESGSVWFSPLSGYAEANPGQWGGANVRSSLEILRRRGILPDKIQPRDYGFKHTLQGTSGRGNNNQSGGGWIGVSQFPEGWQETARWFKALEIIVTTNWEEALCLILHGHEGLYGRNGHAVPPAFWNPVSDVYGYPDSYDVVRYDSASTFKSACRSGICFIMSMTTPNSWDKPAG